MRGGRRRRDGGGGGGEREEDGNDHDSALGEVAFGLETTIVPTGSERSKEIRMGTIIVPSEEKARGQKRSLFCPKEVADGNDQLFHRHETHTHISWRLESGSDEDHYTIRTATTATKR